MYRRTDQLVRRLFGWRVGLKDIQPVARVGFSVKHLPFDDLRPEYRS
jgi:hypothetical protein